jgi:hypothetical protein
MSLKTKFRKLAYYVFGALAGCWLLGMAACLFHGYGADSPLGLRDYASYFLLVSLFGFPAALANTAFVTWSAAKFHWNKLWQWVGCGLVAGFILIGGVGWSAHRLLGSIDVPAWLQWLALTTVGPMELTSGVHAWPVRIALGAAATGAVLYWLRRPHEPQPA